MGRRPWRIAARSADSRPERRPPAPPAYGVEGDVQHPVVICPGNHDERAAFRQFLLGQPLSAAPINQVHHTAAFVVALCDSSVPGKDEGFLEDETLVWLEDVLAQTPDEVPVLDDEGRLTTHYRSVLLDH